MANLQVKGIDDDFYEDLKRLAAAENRSVSQQVLTILRDYLARGPVAEEPRKPADVLLALAGSWEDERSPREIAEELRASRLPSTKLAGGW